MAGGTVTPARSPSRPVGTAPRDGALRGRAAAGPALLALAVVAALPCGALGQVGGAAGRLLDPAPRAPADPFATCATEAALEGGGTEIACDVVEAVDLGMPSEAWLLRYHRTAEVPEGGVVAVVELEEFVVIEASGSGYRTVWHDPVDLRFHSLRAGPVAGVDGATVVAYWTCLQGTGGCAQQFLIRDGGGWGIVEQAYLSDLARLAPEGWSLHKGRELDLSSLTGIQPLLGPDDANCCPAGSIGFSVSLQGRAFVLEDASVDVPEPEPADSTADPGQPPASRDE
jgi:hypothetical protein